jgi:hypothetical protein
MKKSFINANLWVVILMAAGVLTAAAPAERRGATSREAGGRILIVGLHDNVKSNYFYNGMIAEETGMSADSIDIEYNRIIAENIATGAKDDSYVFIASADETLRRQVVSEITLEGEGEEYACNLSGVEAGEWQQMLSSSDADYLLVLNSHYLKWQETPLRTLFHIVSYSLFDKDRQPVYHGNSYFTCMNLESPDRLRKISRKTSSRIASNVIKSLDK